MKSLRIASLLLACCLLASSLPAYARGWEPVRTESTAAKTVARDSDIEIKSAPGQVQITCNHASQVKIFTILGRLVSSDTIPAGTSRFLLPAHGVYIVKIGDLTCKVAV